MKNLLSEIKNDLENFKDSVLSIKNILKEIKLSDKRMVEALGIFNSKAIIFYILNSKKYETFVKDGSIESNIFKISGMLDKINEEIYKEINNVLYKKSVIKLLPSLEHFKSLSMGYENTPESENTKLGYLTFNIDSINIRKENFNSIFEGMFKLTNFGGFTTCNIQMVIPFIEMANGNELLEFLIATYYSCDFKAALLSNATQQYKKVFISEEEIKDNIFNASQLMIKYWENQKKNISFPENYYQEESIYMFYYTLNENLGYYQNDEKAIDFYKDMLGVYNDYQMYFQGIPYKIDKNAIEATKLFLNKWPEIETIMQSAQLPINIKEKKKQKAINIFIKEKWQLHRLQEYSVKEHSHEHNMFLNYLSELMPNYVKSFNLEKKEIVVSKDVHIVEKVKITLDISLKSFTEQTGFTKTDVMDLMDVLEKNRYKKSGVEEQEVIFINKREGFELNIWLELNKSDMEYVDTLTVYLNAYLYKQLLSSLTIIEDSMKEKSPFTRVKNINSIFRESGEKIVFKNKARDYIRQIREENLKNNLEKIDMISGKTTEHASRKKI